MSYGIQALFGPNDFILGSHVQSLCDALDIPHIEARYEEYPFICLHFILDVYCRPGIVKLMYPNFRSDIDMNYKESSLNLQPTQDLMNQAYKVSGKLLIQLKPA